MQCHICQGLPWLSNQRYASNLQYVGGIMEVDETDKVKHVFLSNRSSHNGCQIDSNVLLFFTALSWRLLQEKKTDALPAT